MMSLAQKRTVARIVLWWEQLWPVAWPPLGVLGAYLAAALLDLPALLPPWPRIALLAAILLAAAFLLWQGMRRIARPSPDDVDRRLEQASGLRHRPLSALQDRPAIATPEAASIWAVHQARLQTQIRRLRVDRPRPGLPLHDARALRGLVLIGLAASFVIAGAEAPARLRAAIAPGPATVVQAWVTPPAYTGLPPLFLQVGAPAAPLPVGSRLTVSVTGGRDGPALSLPGDTAEFKALDGASWQAEGTVKAAGPLVVRRGMQQLAAWTLTVIPDLPPTAAWAEPPGPASIGGKVTTQTRLAWTATDDYGVVGLQAELRLTERPDAPPIVVAVPLAGSPKTPHGTMVQDLTAHPWAGLAVTARLIAKDAIGQTGTSDDAPLELPERVFLNEVARAVIAVRKQLSRTPGERAGAKQAMDALADRPDTFQGSASVLLNMRAIGSLLARGRGPAAVDEAQARMWELALALEEGGPERTAQALAQAREAMRDAMETARQNPNDLQAQADLHRRMEELREAIQRHVEALTEQARREGALPPVDPSEPQIARELDRMAQRMEQAAREGRMDDAQREMAEMERLLEQLEHTRPEHGEEREKRNAERRQQGRQQQSAVQDMVRREGDLLDRSRGRADTDPVRPDPRSPAARGPQPEPREPDQRRQAAMRRALGELMQRFGDLTGEVPAPLGEADTAMREAGQALADRRDGAAAAAEQRAIEALQKGAREMGQQMVRQFGRGGQSGEGDEGQDGQEGQEGGEGEGTMGNGDREGRDGNTTGPRPGEQQGPSRRRTTRRDPLGRPLQQGTGGSEETGDVRVPDQMEEARTRALQDELRRRGAERSRPQDELDYIERLLRPF